MNFNEMMRQPIVNQRYRTQRNNNAGKSINMVEVKDNKDLPETGNPLCNKQTELVLGICYVPIQEWEQMYDEDAAFATGTIFPSLNKPFLGGGK